MTAPTQKAPRAACAISPPPQSPPQSGAKLLVLILAELKKSTQVTSFIKKKKNSFQKSLLPAIVLEIADMISLGFTSFITLVNSHCINHIMKIIVYISSVPFLFNFQSNENY